MNTHSGRYSIVRAPSLAIKPDPHHNARRRSGQTLIGLLVVVVIMVCLSLLFIGRRTDSQGHSRPSIAKASINKAYDTASMMYIRQINMAISDYKSDYGSMPQSLDDLKRTTAKNFPGQMWVNQVDGRPLVYNPQTGQVSAQSLDVPAPLGQGPVTAVPASSAPVSGSASGSAPVAAPPAAAPPAAAPPAAAAPPGNGGNPGSDEPNVGVPSSPVPKINIPPVSG